MTWASIFIAVFSVPFVAAASLSRGHRWIIVAGVVLAVAYFTLGSVFAEPSRDLNKLGTVFLLGVITFACLVVWGLGLALGYTIGWAFRRRRPSPTP